MKAILKFDLPDDATAFRAASNANDLALALWDLDNEMRDNIKYHDNQHDTDHWRERLHILLEERSINLDSLIE